uniref:Tachykinin 1 n=1 Tax=Naja naja TaxID=35670 RepID=A0A8C6YAY3_NAJNA
MSSAGVGPLCFIKSRVNAAMYQEILKHFMLSSTDKLYGDADFIFQQDWAPQKLPFPFEHFLQRIARRPRPQQFYGLMGKRDAGYSPVSHKRYKTDSFVGLMGKRSLNSGICSIPRSYLRFTNYFES